MLSRAPKDVLTTREAAHLLGLSVSSVQRLVMDQGREAWVTPAGHRRISRHTLERFRAVITDLAMPPFDGFQLVNALATEPEYADIAVLVVTGRPHDDPDLQQRLPDWVSVYNKPVEPQRLIGYVDALCSRLLRARSTVACTAMNQDLR